MFANTKSFTPDKLPKSCKLKTRRRETSLPHWLHNPNNQYPITGRFRKKVMVRTHTSDFYLKTLQPRLSTVQQFRSRMELRPRLSTERRPRPSIVQQPHSRMELPCSSTERQPSSSTVQQLRPRMKLQPRSSMERRPRSLTLQQLEPRPRMVL
jgi:hypothetical protein